MLTENIITFLQKGELTNFPFGTEIDTITNQLGNNADWIVSISRKDKRAAIIKYDQTEFYFDDQENQKLIGIQITYSLPADKSGFVMDYQEFREALDYDQIIYFLNKNNISFEEIFSKYDNADRVIHTTSHVTFYFTDGKMVQKFGRFLKQQ